MPNKITDGIIKTEKIAWMGLDWLQNPKLKDFYVESKDKLKRSLQNNNYIDPLKVWEDETGKVWILDGCHRQAALMECQKEGIEIPELLTANFINCRDKKHALKNIKGWETKTLFN